LTPRVTTIVAGRPCKSVSLGRKCLSEFLSKPYLARFALSKALEFNAAIVS
jgi:hypothetical protein